jgi:hydroxylamine reductase
MLPAHGYPKLKAYPHLRGNFGTAWQNQQKEFADIPAPVLFTTNCLMPVRDSYRDRVFTTEVVSYPGMVHIGEDKDFTPVIDKALQLGGYSEDTSKPGINGGTRLQTGFGHGTVLSVAGQVIDAVKSGAIRHFFLVGGCDGARPGRNYTQSLSGKRLRTALSSRWHAESIASTIWIWVLSPACRA